MRVVEFEGKTRRRSRKIKGREPGSIAVRASKSANLRKGGEHAWRNTTTKGGGGKNI